MRVIGFDTATDDTVVAAASGGRPVFARRVGPDPDGRPRHSETLLAAVSEAAGELGGWERLDRLAIGVGPGTFTGIRIGIATGRGLSLSTGIPAVGVSTLAALALGIGRAVPGEGPVIPLLDARRGEVFAGFHDADGRELMPPLACPPEELGLHLDRLGPEAGPDPRIAGPGAVRFAAELERAGLPVADVDADVHRLPGEPICELGAGSDPAGPEGALAPVYLRNPDAQLWLERDRPDPFPG